MRNIALLLCCSMLLGAASVAFAQTDTSTTTTTTKKKKKKKKTSTTTNTQSSDSAPAKKKRPLIDEADENMSGQGYGMAGCGLGSIVFGEKTGLIQVVAATLNGTGYQTFGISTGTSNCKTDDRNTAKSASLFITVNREVLAKDISRGNGESLDSLSAIMGCSDSKMLGGKLQQNFNTIFPASNVSSEKSSQKIFEIIKGDSNLAKNCSKIG